ncbi:MAG: tRNA (adenosine(37)-N6)-threonylcarbamoyltransferase complex dimerization subunit type 1 TsaB [Terriglobia bacterium]
MWLLAVDTSSNDPSVALLRDDRLMALVAPRGRQQQSLQLFRSINHALSEAGIGLGEVAAYAVATGPGAFTGLRVGLTLIKSLAEMQGKPIVAVAVLEAVCESAASGSLLLPLVDAYRGQVFAGLYEKQNAEVVRRAPDRVLSWEELVAAFAAEGVVAEQCTLVGPRLERWTPRLREGCLRACHREDISPVLAEAVARRALRKFERGETVDALRLQAHYVRRSDAELLWRGK